MLSGHFSTTLKPPNGNRANLWIPIVRALTLSLPFNSDDGRCSTAYGYNRYTRDEHYCSPKYLITTLIDIVSKDGNYLLNIGPDSDGVVPPPVVQRLKAIGEWLAHSGDCIFSTR